MWTCATSIPYSDARLVRARILNWPRLRYLVAGKRCAAREPLMCSIDREVLCPQKPERISVPSIRVVLVSTSIKTNCRLLRSCRRHRTGQGTANQRIQNHYRHRSRSKRTDRLVRGTSPRRRHHGEYGDLLEGPVQGNGRSRFKARTYQCRSSQA